MYVLMIIIIISKYNIIANFFFIPHDRTSMVQTKRMNCFYLFFDKNM